MAEKSMLESIVVPDESFVSKTSGETVDTGIVQRDDTPFQKELEPVVPLQQPSMIPPTETDPSSIASISDTGTTTIRIYHAKQELVEIL
ncbi:MAG: hypothetical protein ACQ5SW_01660, partial [Sphaerochaetaceae bacterium]